MQVQVIYCDNSHDRVESYTLSSLIREGRITSFERSSGWVHTGKDRIRRYDYAGQERKSAFASHENDLPRLQKAYL
jgi:hypothetical protein